MPEFSLPAMELAASGRDALDTSLDDEFAAEEHARLAQPWRDDDTTEPVYEEHARTMAPTPYLSPMPHGHMWDTPQRSDNPQFATPHADAQYATPRVDASAHATPSSHFLAAAPLTDYRGTPIDRTMRRNLLSECDTFEAAAATALARTADETLLCTLASPQKGAHLRRIETDMHAMHLQPHDEPIGGAGWSDGAEPESIGESAVPAVEVEIEYASVEEVSDAVEELRTYTEHGGDMPLPAPLPVAHSTTPDRERDEQRILIEDACFEESQVGAVSHAPLSSRSCEHRRTPSPRHTQPSRPSTTTPAAAVAWLSPAPAATPLAPTVKKASRVVSSSSSKKKKKKQIPSASTAASHQALPTISPPTRAAWEREKGPLHIHAKSSSVSAEVRQQVQKSLQTIKAKMSSRSPGATAATTNAPACTMTRAAHSGASGMDTARILATLHAALEECSQNESRALDAVAATSPVVQSRAPLANLSNLCRPEENPWMTDAERREAAEARFATPKRLSARVSHTPVKTVSSPAVESSAQPTAPDTDLTRLHHPHRPLLRPATPSLWTRQITPDKVHDNLRYFTTAYAHAGAAARA